MILMDETRIKIEEKDDKTYFLDARSHQAFELNNTSKLICEDLLAGRQPFEIANHLSQEYGGASIEELLSETNSFIKMLEDAEFVERQYVDKRDKNAPILSNVTFGITNRCNLRCKHCLAGSTLGRKDEFSIEKIAELVAEIRSLGCRSASLFGGEPLVREDFWDIVAIFQSAGIGVKVNTNATLVTREFAKKAKEKKIMLFTVSLDGATAKVQDPFRGKGSFEKNIEGIKHLVAEGNRVFLSTTLTKFNYQDVMNIANLAKELGVYKARFNDVHYGGNADYFSDSIRLTPPEKFETLERVNEARKIHGDFVIGSAVDQYGLVHSVGEKDILNFPIVVNPCGAGMGSICIRPEGKVTPCEILWDSVCGDVWEKSLTDIYNFSEEMISFRRALIIHENEIPDCKGCQYLKICYTGHRCSPYFNPGAYLKNQARYQCWVR